MYDRHVSDSSNTLLIKKALNLTTRVNKHLTEHATKQLLYKRHRVK